MYILLFRDVVLIHAYFPVLQVNYAAFDHPPSAYEFSNVSWWQGVQCDLHAHVTLLAGCSKMSLRVRSSSNFRYGGTRLSISAAMVLRLRQC
jgi:hypothetical protein